MNFAAAIAAVFFLVLPLLGAHLVARVYEEPAAERTEDCKDPNSRPGSRAGQTIAVQLG